MDTVATSIAGYMTDAVAIGVAVLSLVVGIKVFQWVRGAL